MTSIPSPYAVSSDPAAVRWWRGLSDESRQALARSWGDDDRADPLHAVARRTAAYLNACVVERDPTERAWEPLDFYENLVGHEARRPAVYWTFSSSGSATYLFDHGLFWPLKNGRIDRNRCSAAGHALLSMHEGSG